MPAFVSMLICVHVGKPVAAAVMLTEYVPLAKGVQVTAFHKIASMKTMQFLLCAAVDLNVRGIHVGAGAQGGKDANGGAEKKLHRFHARYLMDSAFHVES